MKNSLPNINKKKPLAIVLAMALLFSVTFAGVLALFYRTDNPSSLFLKDAQVIVLGEQLYKANCASCHGENLEGQPNWRRRNEGGRMPAPPHDKTGHTWHHADAILFDLIKFGLSKVAGADYVSDMPAFKDTLSDQDVKAVLSYIKSTWPIEITDRHNKVNQVYKTRSADK